MQLPVIRPPRLALVAGFLLLAAAAGAQQPRIDPCTGQEVPATAPPDYLIDWDPAKTMVCADPRPGGRDISLRGMVEWQYCKAASGVYYAKWQVTTRADILDFEMTKDALAAGWPNISLADRERLGRKYAYLVRPLSHPDNAYVWCPAWPQIAAGTPVVAPAPSAWVVAKNGTSSMRPTYAVVAGKRGKINGIADVGADCDVQNAVLEPPFTFGYPRGVTDSVTLCVRRSP